VQETGVFLQFFAVSILAGITEVFWNFLPLLSTEVTITVLGQMIYIACRSAHPIVLLVANKRIRETISDMKKHVWNAGGNNVEPIIPARHVNR